jgi:hypothetical protein
MFKFRKDWGIANLQLVVARENDDDSGASVVVWDPVAGALVTNPAWNEEAYLIAGLADFNFSEKFRGGLLAYYYAYDDGDKATFGDSLFLGGVYAGFKFHPSLELKGIYYYQDVDKEDDSTNAWRVVLDVNQDLLKFTSLWLEYAQFEKGFVLGNQPYNWSNDNGIITAGNDGIVKEDTKVYGVRANQKWNDKWDSYLRYFHAEADNIEDVDDWTVGVGYQLNEAVHFELGYGQIDGGNKYDSDQLIRFQTFVSF